MPAHPPLVPLQLGMWVPLAHHHPMDAAGEGLSALFSPKGLNQTLGSARPLALCSGRAGSPSPRCHVLAAPMAP